MKKQEVVNLYSFIQAGDQVVVDGLPFNVTRVTPHNVYLDGRREAWPAFHRWVRKHTVVYRRNGNELPVPDQDAIRQMNQAHLEKIAQANPGRVIIARVPSVLDELTPVSKTDNAALAAELRTERAMTAFRAVGLAEGFEEGTEEEKIAAWQYLHDSGMAYTLQGWFGRTAQSLIQQGIIKA